MWTVYILLVTKATQKVIVNHASCQILATALQHITSALKNHVINYSETTFSNSNANCVWSIKTLPMSSKSCHCVTCRVLKYLLSILPLYTPHCHMILSNKNVVSCLLVFQQRAKHVPLNFGQSGLLATRSMTGINVGLAQSCVKLLLSLWKTLCAIWRHGISTNILRIFLSLISHGDVPRLQSYGVYIFQLVRFARCCTSVLHFHSKNLQITSKLLTQDYRY